ncbi:MAG: AAA family ATPase [Campylobacterota bacterium]
MELVYLWVEKYKNIENEGFNFSPRFRCEYDKDTNELTIDENKEYVSIFPDNINVTAIVGENGSGKSSIIEAIISRGQGKKILVFNVNRKFHYQSNVTFSSNISIEELENSYLTEFEIDYKGEYSIGYITFDLLKEKFIQTLSHNEDNYLSIKDVDEHIFSYENLFFNIVLDYNSNNGLDLNYKKYNINKILLMLLKSNIELTVYKPLKISFELKSFLLNNAETFNVPEIYDDVKDWNKRYYDIKSLNEVAKNFYLYNTKEFNVEVLFYLFMIMKYLSLEQEEAYFLLKKNGFSFLLDNHNDDNQILEDLRRAYNNLQNYLNDKDYFYYDNYNMRAKLKDIITQENINYLKLFFNTKSITTTINQNINIDLLLFLNKIGFINIDFIDDLGRNFYSLSQGERTYCILELLIINKIKNTKENNIIFLLDEIDISLNPNWQKKIISNLNSIFNNCKNNKFHIILTSHSPFILSDLPKENVIFLKNGTQEKPFKENEQTFGANIHTLLSHGFFMSDGLMGEFAKGKIKKVIKLLNSKSKLSKKSQKFCENIISIIGEPILQKTLRHQLNEKLNSNETELQRLEREQKEIQDKIDKLKGR